MKNERLTITVDTDDETYQHSLRVAQLARSFGNFLGLSQETCEELFTGGMLHDVGKYSVPKEILYKATPVSSEELALIKSHVLLTSTQLNLNKVSLNVQDMILQHHEQIDGLGYPYQLSEDEINPLAQMIGLCDVYDALTSKRCYHQAMSIDQALTIIASKSGTCFFPTLVQSFLRFIQNKEA